MELIDFFQQLQYEIKSSISDSLETDSEYPFPEFVFTDHMIRIDKGPGDFFYAVMFETEDTSYLVKIDVNVDGQLDDDDDKDYYNDDLKGADELADEPDETEDTPSRIEVDDDDED